MCFWLLIFSFCYILRLDLEIRRIFYHNESDFDLKESEGRNFIKIPSGNFENGL